MSITKKSIEKLEKMVLAKTECVEDMHPHQIARRQRSKEIVDKLISEASPELIESVMVSMKKNMAYFKSFVS